MNAKITPAQAAIMSAAAALTSHEFIALRSSGLSSFASGIRRVA